MSAVKIRQSMVNFVSALNRLEQVLDVPLSDEHDKAMRDAVILRFTFVYELAWKNLRRFLIHSQTPPSEISTPRDVMQKAFQAYWLKDDQLWLSMAGHRNLLVHTYNEDLAKEVYERIKDDYAPELRRTYDFLREKFTDILDEPS